MLTWIHSVAPFLLIRRGVRGVSPLIGCVLLSSCIGTDLVGEIPEGGDESIEISVSMSAAEIGQQLQFQAVYYLSDGTIDGTAVFEWSSSNPSVASVDVSGNVSTLAAGQTTIIARSMGEASNALVLTVVSDLNQVAMVGLTPLDIVLTPGGMIQLNVTALNVLNQELVANHVTYLVENATIASVSDSGLLTALVPGTTTVTATIDGVTSASIQVKVLGLQLQGTFTGRSGTVYIVEGTAVLEEDDSGFVTLSFLGDFQASNGPGLHVYLSRSDGVTSTSIDLGDLRSNIGSQKYSIGSGFDTSAFRYVIIHCVPFNVTFGSARLN